jgi:hypothetical protein
MKITQKITNFYFYQIYKITDKIQSIKANLIDWLFIDYKIIIGKLKTEIEGLKTQLEDVDLEELVSDVSYLNENAMTDYPSLEIDDIYELEETLDTVKDDISRIENNYISELDLTDYSEFNELLETVEELQEELKKLKATK